MSPILWSNTIHLVYLPLKFNTNPIMKKITIQDVCSFLNSMNVNSKHFDDISQWGCDLWAFGKDIDGKEIYIKIGLGLPNRNTICVSFHKPDSPITYPFK